MILAFYPPYYLSYYNYIITKLIRNKKDQKKNSFDLFHNHLNAVKPLTIQMIKMNKATATNTIGTI